MVRVSGLHRRYNLLSVKTVPAKGDFATAKWPAISFFSRYAIQCSRSGLRNGFVPYSLVF